MKERELCAVEVARNVFRGYGMILLVYLCLGIIPNLTRLGSLQSID